MFCIVVYCVLVSLSGIAYSLPPYVSHGKNHKDLLPRALTRDVYVVCQLVDLPHTARDGSTEFPMHSFLWVSGTDVDGPLKIEVATKNNNDPYVRVKDFTTAGTSDEIPSHWADSKVSQEKTRLSNKNFLDSSTGKGIVKDALYEDAIYRVGPGHMGNLNTCHTLVERILRRLNIPLARETGRYFDSFDRYGVTMFGNVDQAMEVTQYVEGTDRATNNLKGTFDTPTDHCRKGNMKRGGACSRASQMPADVLDVTSTDTIPSRPPPASVKAGQGLKVSIVKNGGVLTRFTSIGTDAVAGLGVAATVAGAVFVILDFVDHNWVGGAIGAVGLAASLAAGFALSGPLGWVVGGAIAALFAILLGLFQVSHPPADRTDIQGIIQWKLFGDKDHTGNAMPQGTKDVPGNKDCQALYGAGTLSMAMGMNNFDAIVFLTQGYAMSIKDMVAAFYVVDDTKLNDGADQIATIECHNKKGKALGRAGTIGGDRPSVCDNPTFSIKRNLIHLPNIGATADMVFNRIIPAPNGDCKLIAHPGDAVFPNYGITLNGLPSAIACGLTAAINVQGVAVPIDGGTTPQTGSNGDQSTDGQGGAYVAPPPKAPFKSLDPTGYVCLSHDTHPPFCLPPGTYKKQSGLGFKIKDVNSLTLPPGGWSLSTHWKHAPQYRDPRPQGFTNNVYTTNQDPTNKSSGLTNFHNDMSMMDLDRDGDSSFEIKGPNDGPDPICCLFSGTQFGGNVWCVGVGGGDALPQWTNIAQSVSCHDGGNVWLYAQTYGDTGGALVTGNVEDLSNEPYGNKKGTFSKNVKALWVLKGLG